MDDDFWKAVREKEQFSTASNKTGVLNIALLFGTAVIALTLIVTPMLAERTKSNMMASAPEFDTMTTGSISRPGARTESENGKRYTIRRSILQDEPGAVCVIQGFGARPGC